MIIDDDDDDDDGNSDLMDSNNWGPNQSTEPPGETPDWRIQLQSDSRLRIVNKIMDTLRKHLPVSGPEGLHELRQIAQRFEDKIYSAATSQLVYERSLRLNLQSQVLNQGQQHPNPLPSQQQPRQQLLSQTIQNNGAPQPNFPSVSNLSQIPNQNIGQNSNTHQPGQNSAINTVQASATFPNYQAATEFYCSSATDTNDSTAKFACTTTAAACRASVKHNEWATCSDAWATEQCR
ncbi:hypothetical protein TSUD_259580 [Trifolium subterraneum]|uniref:Mediator complex subunit 15 KIX domain-containing protein n=1 Tax=Trifolium subterraneum TaxID=3900 RepID=A0A2Z6NSW6_TRISU|nr:hypothetical protein TSUD_259580 [Trifolium subterraneum]